GGRPGRCAEHDAARPLSGAGHHLRDEELRAADQLGQPGADRLELARVWRDLGAAGAAAREDVPHDGEAAHVEQEVVDLAVEQGWGVGVEQCGGHAASFRTSSSAGDAGAWGARWGLIQTPAMTAPTIRSPVST